MSDKAAWASAALSIVLGVSANVLMKRWLDKHFPIPRPPREVVDSASEGRRMAK